MRLSLPRHARSAALVGAVAMVALFLPERAGEFIRLTLLSGVRLVGDVLPDADRDARIATLEEENRALKIASREKKKNSASSSTSPTHPDLPGTVIFREAARARVALSDPSSWSQTVIIDRGQKDGVARGMAVVTGPVLVGRVREAGLLCSRVTLITDQDSKIPVTIGDLIIKKVKVKGEVKDISLDRVGVCRGSGKFDLMVVKWLTRADGKGVREGDRVYSSGFGGVFPRGLVVGRVVRVRDVPGQKFLEIDVRPAAPLERVSRVEIRTVDVDSALLAPTD